MRKKRIRRKEKKYINKKLAKLKEKTKNNIIFDKGKLSQMEQEEDDKNESIKKGNFSEDFIN